MSKGFKGTPYTVNYIYKVLNNKARGGVSRSLVEKVIEVVGSTNMQLSKFKKIIKEIDSDYQIPTEVLEQRLRDMLEPKK